MSQIFQIPEKENIMGYNIVTQQRDLFTSKIVSELRNHKNRRVYTLNPHSYCISRIDHAFKRSLKDAEYIIPDGTGIVLASILLGGHVTKRITGFDIFAEVQSKLNSGDGVKVAFFGSSQDVLDKIKAKMEKQYSKVKIVSMISPPFRQITKEENEAFCHKINKSGAEILWVGMTAPKQEKWIAENIHQLNINLIVPIGAAFDFYAETVKRPGLMWRRLGLEWMPRFFKDPFRLWQRNLVSTPLFLGLLIKAKIQKLFQK